MGDQIGTQEFDKISDTPIKKWKNILNTRYRIKFSRDYIHFLGDEVLKSFDTSIKETCKEIDSIDAKWEGTFTDIFFHLMSNTKRWTN